MSFVPVPLSLLLSIPFCVDCSRVEHGIESPSSELEIGIVALEVVKVTLPSTNDPSHHLHYYHPLPFLLPVPVMDVDDAALAALEREAAAFDGDIHGDAEMEAEMEREEARIKKILASHQDMSGVEDDADMNLHDGVDGDVISDDDVMDELNDLEREVHGGGANNQKSELSSDRTHGDGDGDFDEDAMLAEAEAEADRLWAAEERSNAKPTKITPATNKPPPPPPQPRQPVPPARPAKPALLSQQVLSTSNMPLAPAQPTKPPPPPPSSASIDSLPDLNAKLLQLKTQAVELNRAGKKPEALEVMRHIKAIQGKIEELKTKQHATSNVQTTAKTNVSIPSSSGPPSSSSSTSAAVVSSSSSSSAPPALVSSSSHPSKLTIRAELEYDSLLRQLDEQIASLDTSMKTLVSEGTNGGGIKPGSKESKLLALQYWRAKQRSVKDRDLLRLAKERGLRPPGSHTEELVIQSELSFPQLGEDTLEVVIGSGRDLHNTRVVSTNDLVPLVSISFEYATDLEGGVKTTSPVWTPPLKGSNPKFEHLLKLSLPYSRSSGTKDTKMSIKKLLRSKVLVQVHHKRFLLGPTELCRSDIRLKEMSLKSEYVTILKLKDLQGQQRCGELEVTLRLKKPFEGLDIRQVRQNIIVVDEFEEERNDTTVTQIQTTAQVANQLATPIEQTHNNNNTTVQPAPTVTITPASTHTPVPASVAAPAVAAPSASIAAPPSSSSLPLTGDPHSISKLRSNDVLEAEIVLLTRELSLLKSRPRPPDDIDEDGQSRTAAMIDEITDKLTAANIALEVLVTRVQNGKLTLADYIEQLKVDIVSESQLALQLAKSNRKPDAARIIQRVKLMKAEVEGAEENQEELEKC